MIRDSNIFYTEDFLQCLTVILWRDAIVLQDSRDVVFDVLIFMDLPHYHVSSNKNGLRYTFYSDGPRGRILKVIQFKLYQAHPDVIFNISLGDLDESTNEIDNNVISDNGDALKILRTVAESIIRFCRRYPQCWVLIRGNTPARNRLYRMRIVDRLGEIEKRCKIYGVIGANVVDFCKDEAYNGFLVKAVKNANFK